MKEVRKEENKTATRMEWKEGIKGITGGKGLKERRKEGR